MQYEFVRIGGINENQWLRVYMNNTRKKDSYILLKEKIMFLFPGV